MRNRTRQSTTLAFMFAAMILITGIVQAGDFEEAKKNFQKAFQNGSTQQKVDAIKELAATKKKKGYAMIFNKVMQVSEVLWKQKEKKKRNSGSGGVGGGPGGGGKSSGQTLDKDKLKIQNAGINAVRNINDDDLLMRVFEATAIGGNRRGDNIVRRWVAKKANLSGRLASMDAGEPTRLLLKLIQRVEQEYNQIDKKLDRGGQTKILKLKLNVLDGLRNQVSKSIAKVSSDGAIDAMIEDGLNHPSPARQEAVARTMADMSDSRTKNAIKDRLKKSGSYRLKVLLIRAAKKRKIVTAEIPVADHLTGQPGSVVRAAANCLEVIGTKESVPKLIEALKTARGRTAVAIGDALEALTPMDFGRDYKSWKDWWKKNKDGVDVEKEKKKHRKKKGKNRRGRPNGGGNANNGGNDGGQGVGKKHKTSTFFGHEIKSHKIAFIIDISGSMKQPANLNYKDEDEGPVTGEGERKGPGHPPFPKDPPKSPSKLDAAKYELGKAIWGLKEEQHFNIIFYSSNPNIWKKNTLVKATRPAVKAAIRFVYDKNPSGSTNVYDSVKMAFELGDPQKNTAVDTIFLLSDGMPNQGKYTEANAIIKNVNKMNKIRKVKINTVVLGSSGGSSKNAQFLKRLANENDGNFRDPAKKNN